jgi:hypothetical protein
VYLFVEVRASPAAPQPRTATKDDPKPTKDEGDEGEAEKPKQPPRPRGTGAGMTGRFSRKTGGGTTVETPTPPTGTPAPDATAQVKLTELMAEANKAFDKADFEEAKTIANKVLKQDPRSPRMLRILVNVACIDHDGAEAQKHYNLLNDKSDRDVMRTRCQRDFGIALVEPPPKK